jgi:hypothetical protein
MSIALRNPYFCRQQLLAHVTEDEVTRTVRKQPRDGLGWTYGRWREFAPQPVTLSPTWQAVEPLSRTNSMAENKTKPTDASVEDYIARRGSERQRDDCRELIALFRNATRQPPRMWGPSIVGFGSYRYTYESGHTGEAPLAGFAIRGRELVIYLVAEQDEQKFLLSRLGPHRMTRSCLYFKRLADLDRSVLQELVARSVEEVRRRYG